MTNEEFDAIMEGTAKELATQQSWLDKQKDNVDHIYKLFRGLKELEGQLRREMEERVLERDVLEKKLAEARAAYADKETQYLATCDVIAQADVVLTTLRLELAEARSALQEIDSTTVPSGFLRVWRERHPAALKAAREAKQ